MVSGASGESAEIEFMANYAWRTLIALYERLELEDRLKLRSVDRDLEVGGDAAAALKLLRAVRELSAVVREILRRMAATLVQELEVSGSAKGRVAVGLAAKHMPRELPVVRARLELETPANLLLAATLVEVRDRILELIRWLPAAAPETKPLRELAEERLRGLLCTCEYLLYEPALRPLLAKAQLLAADRRRLAELEERVELDALRRPRELRAYRRLLELRKRLREGVRLLGREVERLGEALALRLAPEKLYELYGFSILLQALAEALGLRRASVDRGGRELRLETEAGAVSVFYNVLPEGVESRVAKARAVGLIDGEVRRELVEALRGLPDTIVVKAAGGSRKLLLLDYKYTREYRYLSQARFKALAYIYEFNADCGVVVAPTPSEGGWEDEEAHDHRGFYDEIAKRGGASILIDSNGKILAVVYADPCESAAESALRALKAAVKLVLT